MNVAILLLIGCCLLPALDAKLVLVYSVNRHGARNVLNKNANLTESDAYGGAALLPEGEKMCYDAGMCKSCAWLAFWFLCAS